MTDVGKAMGVEVSHQLNPMDEPLGRSVGNALEVAECVETLQGGGPPDLVKLTLDLAEKVSDTSRKELAERLTNGRAWKKFVALVYAQDGDATALEEMSEIHRAPVIKPMLSKKAGSHKENGCTIHRPGVGSPWRRTPKDRRLDRLRCRLLRHQEDRRTRRQRTSRCFFVHARDEKSYASVLPFLRKAVAVAP